MKFSALATIALVAGFAAAPSAPATGATVEDLLRACRALEKATVEGNVLTLTETVAVQQCWSFIAGYYDGWWTARLYVDWAPRFDNPGLNFCPLPVTYITNLQLARIFVRWAEQHPERHHYQDWEGLRSAFAEAFPCR